MIDSKGSLRCSHCGKKLAEGFAVGLSATTGTGVYAVGIVPFECPRCKQINVFKQSSSALLDTVCYNYK